MPTYNDSDVAYLLDKVKWLVISKNSMLLANQKLQNTVDQQETRIQKLESLLSQAHTITIKK